MSLWNGGVDLTPGPHSSSQERGVVGVLFCLLSPLFTKQHTQTFPLSFAEERGEACLPAGRGEVGTQKHIQVLSLLHGRRGEG